MYIDLYTICLYVSNCANSQSQTASPTVTSDRICTTCIATCSGICTDTTTSATNCGGCGTTCGTGKICTSSTCVGNGNLRITLTWSRNGDGDIVVALPGSKYIEAYNKGPSAATNNGLQDVDNRAKGPENVYWQPQYTPPSGTYYLCFVTYSFSTLSTSNPVTATFVVSRPYKVDLTFTKSFTATTGNGNALYTSCGASSANRVGTFTYP